MKKMLALMLLAMTFTLTAEAIKADDNCCCPPPPKCDCDKPDPQFGYFYLTEEQCVETCFDSVSWENAGSVNTDGIFIDSSNADRIVLKKKGYYLVTYTVTGEVFFKNGNTADTANTPAQPEPGCCNKFQFALYLNEGYEPIPGSTYAGNNQNFNPPAAPDYIRGECATEVVGQVIFRVNEKDSFIQLVNQSENNVLLDNEAGTNCPQKFGFNVSASIAIQRLSGLNLD